MRKLASVQEVADIVPIEGADRIERASVLGWQCVVEKGLFSPGDLGVYFEIDSFLPVRKEFEFLRKGSYRKTDFMGEGFRIRSMKFRGKLSQGLLLPVDVFEELDLLDLEPGTDVTELLGVREWAEPERVGSSGTIKGARPSWIPKTEEARIQSVPSVIQEFNGRPYYITTKMDGSSHSIGVRDGEVHYASHNCELKDDGLSPFVEYCKKQGIDVKAKECAVKFGCSELVIQGEWCGAGIQKNRLKLKAPAWFVFTVVIDGRRTSLAGLEQVCAHVGCHMVPVEETGNLLGEMYPSVDSLLRRAEGIGYNETPREGIVVRPMLSVHSELLQGWLSFKVVSNSYLLAHDA